jgi:predicted pyridoxine 5'-phosphate oxidase superfamily flavin-nucleotide-binding protein
VLPDDVVALLESGCSTFVGAVDADGRPVASHTTGIQVVEDGTRLRVMVNRADEEAIAALQASGVVAVGATDVYTLRSIQVKGRVVGVEPATAEDRIRTDAYIAAFSHAVYETDGTDVDFMRRALPADFVALVTTIEDVFDQTPGPHAGTNLART